MSWLALLLNLDASAYVDAGAAKTTHRGIAPEDVSFCVVDAYVDETGALVEAQPRWTCDPRVLDAAAETEFVPHEVDGVAVKARYVLSYGDPGPMTRQVTGLAVGPTSVHIGDVRVRRQVAPKYPDAMKAARTEANCRMRVDIDAKGKVTDVKPEDCPEGFQAEAEAALYRWAFYPYTQNDVPVPVTFVVTIKFVQR